MDCAFTLRTFGIPRTSVSEIPALDTNKDMSPRVIKICIEAQVKDSPNFDNLADKDIPKTISASLGPWRPLVARKYQTDPQPLFQIELYIMAVVF